MKPYARRKQLVRYRFKDRLNCVFFRNFNTRREAMLWFEKNKTEYMLKDFNFIGIVY